jgi:hypothetical protein
MSQDTIVHTTCQWIGPGQDPLRDYPITYCGCKTIKGKAYCGEHYWQVYDKGTAIAGKRKAKSIDAEIEELKRQQELEELENE